MTKYERSLMSMISEAGLQPRDISRDGKHLKISVMTPAGDIRTIVASKTPSCHKASLNLRSYCRNVAA